MPLLYLSAAFMTGVYAASLWHSSVLFQLVGPTIGIALLVISRWLSGFRLPSLCILAFTLGTWRFDNDIKNNSGSDALAAMTMQRTVEIRGIVDASPEMREMRQNIRLSISALRKGDGWEEARGVLLIFADVAPRFQYGDSLEVVGRLEKPPEFDGFNYGEYLSRQGIHYVMQRPYIKPIGRGEGVPPLIWIDGLRFRLLQVLGTVLPEPEASVAQGILLGARSSMPRDLLNSFAATGTTHILAISGYNITLIAAVLIALACRIVGANPARYVAAGGIGLYSVLAGTSPSVMRATVMGILVIVAYRAGRQSHVLNALALSGAVLVAIQPQWLWDVGFQLSFLATVGLLFVSRPVSLLLERATSRVGVLTRPILREANSFAIEGLSITLAATIYTLPLIASNFHSISMVSPLANVFAVPALPPIMAGAAATASIGTISPPLGQLAAYAALPFVSYLIGVVKFFAGLPYASLATPAIGSGAVWIYYFVLGALTFALHIGKTGLSDAWLRLKEWWREVGEIIIRVVGGLPIRWIAMPLLLATIMLWAAVFSLPDDRLHVTFLDVGQGDAILIRTPDNRKLLVDGGPSPQRLLNKLGESMPFWDRTIDIVILTHPDEDHLSGLLGALDSYQIKLVVEGQARRSTPIYRAWQESITQKGIQHEVVLSGQRITLGDVQIDVVFSPEPKPDDAARRSNESLVLKLKTEEVSFLLPGDTPAESQVQLLASSSDVASTVLKVPHHGARDALDQRFLGAVNPQLAVISVGADNNFGHPAPETLTSLGERRVLRTDLSGSVEVVTDGRVLWIKTKR